MKRIKILLAGSVLTMCLLSGTSLAAAPSNDDFLDAQLLDGISGKVKGSNIDATKQAQEPDHAGNPGGHSVWYRWTAPADALMAFKTSGSNFDTVLAAYTGGSLDTLSSVAANDDFQGRLYSRITFAATEGTTYQIAVDGFYGKVGTIKLAWGQAPNNDDFSDAQIIAGSFGSVDGSTVESTTEPGEPRRDLDEGSVWYRWTAPEDGETAFLTDSDFDTLLSVFTGDSIDSLTRIAGDDDGGIRFDSIVRFDSIEGTVYQVRVSGYGRGSFALRWLPVVRGSANNDTILGTPNPEFFLLDDGDDGALGEGGADVFQGGDGSDHLVGGEGDDIFLRGSGSDDLVGGTGDDRAEDFRGRDRLLGRDGNDELNADDGHRGDVLNGGDGVDRCRGDRGDTKLACE